jgi:recombination protein RecR
MFLCCFCLTDRSFLSNFAPMNSFPSRLLEDAVNEMSSLPGIGKKTAVRLVLHLLKRPGSEVERFSKAFVRLKNEMVFCKECHTISDTDCCHICSDPHRDRSLICVVEDIRDVLALENTHQYKGLYHVLGGIISPMDGTGPSDLAIDSLLKRVATGEPLEVIMALSATMEGDTTNFYLFRKLSGFPIKLSTLARGVSVGDELEYADEITLGRSILYRTPFEQSLNR